MNPKLRSALIDAIAGEITVAIAGYVSIVLWPTAYKWVILWYLVAAQQSTNKKLWNS